ncbi:MAG: hypothetical protein COU69_02165 [Candidatus Pacebacteria bacterium CG10_big_fil_rev_8_21_14_0_10_56_10]|nr:MAG: hypothetical protein COU69_02165 [Candidatus Pacebacteria bacterium CG10_big_fil_rev_8_21_14_0_10_56_10]
MTISFPIKVLSGRTWLLPAVVVAGVVLAACSNQATDAGTPGTAVGNGSGGNSRASQASPQVDETEFYVTYSAAAVDQALADGKRSVLFFHANWCPTCRSAERDILKNMDQIPEDVVIFKTDFDRERQLKQEHGVVAQHSFVVLNEDGSTGRRWSGGGLDSVLQRI